MTKIQIESAMGSHLVRQWVLDGSGPARFGWASVHACKLRWEGRTLAEVVKRLTLGQV